MDVKGRPSRMLAQSLALTTPSRGARMHGPTDHRTRRRGAARRVAACLTLLTLAAAPLAVIPAGPALAADVNDGLLLRYPLDAASGTVATDASGNGRNGVV